MEMLDRWLCIAHILLQAFLRALPNAILSSSTLRVTVELLQPLSGNPPTLVQVDAHLCGVLWDTVRCFETDV